MKKNDVLKEAKRLHDLGIAVHWLHAKSKRPVESGWTTGARKDFEYLKKTYVEGLNIGARLGEVSKIGNGYLAVIDVDVKSKEAKHAKEAHKAALDILKGAGCPVVNSGRGNGSRHYYFLTKKSFKTFNPAVSLEKVKVMMPSKKPSKKELESLTESEITQGLRIANAWEISLYSEGRQVVVPPSLHPDTNKGYTWGNPLVNLDSLPFLEINTPEEGKVHPKIKPVEIDFMQEQSLKGKVSQDKFEICPIDIEWLPISEKMREAIIHGTGVQDRSAYLLLASCALLSSGLNRNEVLSVLTDRKTFLGEVGYEHAKTNSRMRAAHWIWKYSLKKIMNERDAVKLFEKAPPVERSVLNEKDSKLQAGKIEEEGDWRQYLEADKNGKYKPTLHNCKTILSNICGKGIVGRNEFAANDFYLIDSPWRSKKKDAVLDHDIVRIKFYCVEHFGVEFSDKAIEQSLLEIADLHRFHPIREWLKTLKWDGVRRIDTWFKDYMGAVGPEPYLTHVSRKVLVALIARIMNPGCKFDHMLILEGEQDVGKSTIFRKLVGELYYSDAPLNIGDKDTVMSMQAKWVIEVGELSVLNKSDTEELKAFIVQQTDRIRVPFGKKIQDFPRQSIFVGNTNKDEYLKDITGNRRFWTVKTTGRLDFEGVEKIREQLLAEAVYFLEVKKEPLYLENPLARKQAKIEQESRMESDAWLSIVEDILNFETFPIEGFEIRDVAKKMETVGAHRMSPFDVQRIAKCLRMLGFERGQHGRPRKKLWGKKDEIIDFL